MTSKHTQMKTSVICLVSISLSRGYIEDKHKVKRMEKIKKRMIECFPEIIFFYDSIPGGFDLNQNYGETIIPLATSFGLMDFVALPLSDSIWINKLYITNEIDIRVCYVENYDTDNQTYQDHKSFPNWKNISTYEYPEERSVQFNNALKDMITKQEIKHNIV